PPGGLHASPRNPRADRVGDGNDSRRNRGGRRRTEHGTRTPPGRRSRCLARRSVDLPHGLPRFAHHGVRPLALEKKADRGITTPTQGEVPMIKEEVQRLKALCTRDEFALYRESLGSRLEQFSSRDLRSRARRARNLRDKYNGAHRRQRSGERGKLPQNRSVDLSDFSGTWQKA